MDEQELIQILDGQGKRTARRRWNCPSDNKIASYLEHRLEAKDKARVEAHLANCDFCLSAVGELVRQQRASEAVEVTGPLLRNAIDLVPLKTGWTLSWKWLLVPALASVVLITAILQRSPQPERSGRSVPAPTVEAKRSAEEIPQTSSRPQEKQYVRKMVASAPGLQLVEPKLNTAWQKEALRFRWRSVANAAYYEVRVVNSEGDLVWQGQASDLSTQFPPDLPLVPGKYFVWVRAYLNDGRTIKSEAVAFRIVGSS
jgi:hypothetical protein